MPQKRYYISYIKVKVLLSAFQFAYMEEDVYKRQQLDGVEKLYESVTGEQMTKFYRPPQGIYSTTNLTMAKELGYSTFFWSLAYVDWIQDQQPSSCLLYTSRCV